MQSELLNELFASLAMAQGDSMAALKSTAGQVGQQRTKYADLASCWDACRAPLAKHGLAVVQLASADGARVTVQTTLGHKSGQWISGELSMTSSDPSPRGIGSAITYARRYSLCALVGIAPEDDDGEAASRTKEPSRPVVSTPKPRTESATANKETKPEVAGKSDVPSGRIVPDALATRFDAIDHDVKNIAPAFVAMEKALIDKAGANGVKSYARIVDEFRRVIPKGSETKLDIKECLLDLWDELQVVEHPLGDLVMTDKDKEAT